MRRSLLDLLRDPARLFALRGGVHPLGQKFLASNCAIERMPIPTLLRVPLQQHIGAPAEPVVVRDDLVLKGQLIGRARGPISANVHAPTSGRVLAVGHFAAPHPSGLPVPTITIRPDGEDRWGPRLPRLHPEDASADEISAQVREAGIVGMGGATFPSAVKLGLHEKYDLDTLVINAAECEPYLTCDDRLLQEHAEEVADGIAIMARALGVRRALIAIESNKPKAITTMRHNMAPLGEMGRLVVVPTRYPMGSEKHLVQALTGKETPARALTAEMGIVVHNAATAYAVHLAVRYGEPLLSRVVTVSGRAIKRPANVRVLIGTPVADILDHCGGFARPAKRLVLGGPMMGQPIENLRVPVVKGTNGILALTAAETASDRSMPCIRCGSCVQACPVGLTPLELNARIQAGDLEGAEKVGLLDCIACGSCSFICPASIPLVQSFNYAKGKLAQRQSEKHRQEETKRLAEARKAREAALAKAKREAMAKRKAEMAAKKKRAAAEKAAEARPPGKVDSEAVS